MWTGSHCRELCAGAEQSQAPAPPCSHVPVGVPHNNTSTRRHTAEAPHTHTLTGVDHGICELHRGVQVFSNAAAPAVREWWYGQEV